MIFILLFTVITLCSIIVIMRSGKPVRQILTEIKYELIIQFLGGKALIEDFLFRNKNKTDLPNRSGQVALVTGGSRGIGIEIVKMFMQCDMHVIIGCRNVNAGEKLLPLFRKLGIKTGEIQCFQLDTASKKSVREFAAKIKEKYPKINILVNNAGIMFGPYVVTEDEFESQLAVNYLGHFLLTHLLMPELKAAGTENTRSRIVNVSSIAHLAGDINFDDIHFKQQYIPTQAYAQSKLAQVMFTNYLDSQLASLKIPVQVNSVHPGIVNTDLFKDTPLKKIFPWMPNLLFKDATQGAMSVVHAALSPKLEGKGGKYISNCRITAFSNYAKSVEKLEKLFEVTKKMLNINEFGA